MIARPWKRITNYCTIALKSDCAQKEKIINELINSYDNKTLDDIVRLITNLSLFDNFNKQHVTDLTDKIENTSRFDEIFASPQHAVSILQSMITLEIYPEKLINSVLQLDFITKFLDGQWIIKPLLAIRDAVSIECPLKYDEKIKQLDELLKDRKLLELLTMEKLLPSKPRDLSYSQKYTVLLYLACREFYPKQTVSRNILTFCKNPEIIICDSRFNPIITGKEIEIAPNSVKDVTVIRREKSPNMEPEFFGYLRLRHRLLEKMGFRVFFIPESVSLNKKNIFKFCRAKIGVKIDG